MELISGRDVETALSIATRERWRYAQTGILIPIGTLKKADVYDKADVDRLCPPQRMPITPPRPSIAVRLAEPKQRDDSTDPDDWMGWNEAWTDNRKMEAARKYWAVADPDALIGGALIAIVGRFIVGAWRILEAPSERDKIAFKVKPDPKLSYLEAGTIELGRGPLTKVWQ